MGVSDFNVLLKRIGFQRDTNAIQKSVTLGIDAMGMLFKCHSRAVLKLGLKASLEPLVKTIEQNSDVCILVRDEVVIEAAKYLNGFVEVGSNPIIIWDGVGRSEGKREKKHSPFLLRSEDRRYVKDTLKLMGYPSIIGASEGEKTCCVLSQLGLVDIVLSRDSDCVILGAKCVATDALAIAGYGLRLDGCVNRDKLATALETTSEKLGSRLIDMAVFLGCDFCRRLPKNGPASYHKKYISTGHNYLDEARITEDKEYLQEVDRTVTFYTVNQSDVAETLEKFSGVLESSWNPDILTLEKYALYDRIKMLIPTRPIHREYQELVSAEAAGAAVHIDDY